MASILCFGEPLLTYTPASAAGEAEVEIQVQAVGGAELNVAVAYSGIGGAAKYVSVVPDGALGDLVMRAGAKHGVDMQPVVRVPESSIGTLHVVDPDGRGKRPLYQRRNSAFCSTLHRGSFRWKKLLSHVPWLVLSGITPALGTGPLAAWKTALETASASGSSTATFLDLNHRPALGSLSDLWGEVSKVLPQLSMLVLSEDTLRVLAEPLVSEGLLQWPSEEADPAADPMETSNGTEGAHNQDALHTAQREALGMLRANWGVPLLGCCFKRSAQRAGPQANGAGHKNALGRGGLRRWSTVAFEGGLVSTSDTPVVHTPVQALGGGDAWAAGFLRAVVKAKLQVPPPSRTQEPSGSPGSSGGELAAALRAGCRSGDLLAALQMATPGDQCHVTEASLNATECQWEGVTADLSSDPPPSHLMQYPALLPAGASPGFEALLRSPAGPFHPNEHSMMVGAGALMRIAAVLGDSMGQARGGGVYLPGSGAPAGAWGSGVSASPVFERLAAARVVPVVSLDDESDAVPVAQALLKGGLAVMELVLRTPAAEAALQSISSAVPGMLVGAGTVLSVAQAERAVAGGAAFLVAPGLNHQVVEWACSHHIPIIPGAATATEVEMGMQHGLRCFKFFPAEAMGGAGTLAALAGPYKNIRWMPTGGVSMENLAEYLALPSVMAAGGSWLTPPDVIKRKDYEAVSALASAAVAAASEAQVAAGEAGPSKKRKM